LGTHPGQKLAAGKEGNKVLFKGDDSIKRRKKWKTSCPL